MSSGLSSSSETDVSELPDNLEDMLLVVEVGDEYMTVWTLS